MSIDNTKRVGTCNWCHFIDSNSSPLFLILIMRWLMVNSLPWSIMNMCNFYLISTSLLFSACRKCIFLMCFYADYYIMYRIFNKNRNVHLLGFKLNILNCLWCKTEVLLVWLWQYVETLEFIIIVDIYNYVYTLIIILYKISIFFLFL
jgi:hypothetical protein